MSLTAFDVLFAGMHVVLCGKYPPTFHSTNGMISVNHGLEHHSVQDPLVREAFRFAIFLGLPDGEDEYSGKRTNSPEKAPR